MFLFKWDAKLTDTAAGGILDETLRAPLLWVAAEGASCVGAKKVWSTVVGSQGTLIYVWSRQGGTDDQSINILCINPV